MKTYNLLSILLLFMLGFSACPAQATGKNTETQNRKAEPFHAIKVSTGIDLYITQGSSEKITVEADEDIINELVTEIRDGVLKIYMEKSFNWKWNRERKVFVTFKDLDLLVASSGSDVESSGLLQVKNLKIDTSSGSDIELEIDADQLYVSTSSGSDATLKGLTNYLEASSSSGSDLDAGELKAKVCEVSASSGSDAIVSVSERIKASASSGADVCYHGDPSSKDINESSGGDIVRH